MVHPHWAPPYTFAVLIDIKEKNYLRAKQSKNSHRPITRMKNKTQVLLKIWCCMAILAIASIKTVDAQDINESTENKLTKKMDELNEKDNISIYGDMITLEKMKIEEDQRENSNVEHDPLIAKIDQFFRSRKLRIRLPTDGSSADFFGRALGQKNFDVELARLTTGASEARTKLKRIVLPILLALKLKALIILPIVITMIGLVGIKGLGAGLLALLLSGAVALKALLTPPPSFPARVSYGIVKPHEIHHEHWHRSQEEISQPFRAWAPEISIDSYPYNLH